MTNSERLKSVIDYKKMNANSFSEAIGLPTPDMIYRILNRNTTIGSKMARRITAKYPEINTAWLEHEEGNMLKESEEKKKNAYEQDSKPSVVEENGADIIQRILKQNEDMLATINRLLTHQETYKDVIKENAESIKNLTSQEKINAQTINNLTQLELKNAETISNLSAGSKNVPDAATGGR